jgi:galactose mutarotase-like enzyme
MAVTVSSTEVQGFAADRVTNGLVEVVVVPELGGKLASLRDVRTDREWLWTSSVLPYARHPYGAPYVEVADTGGWDECFPSVAACTHRGTDIPDHGEVWSQSWPSEVGVSHGDGRSVATVRSEAHGVAWPYSFRRTITVEEGQPAMALRYEVTNDGDQPLDFIWSAHPLFRIEPGMRVRVPGGATFHTYSDRGRAQLDGDLSRLDPLPGPEAGFATKLWTDPLPEGWAELVSASGAETLRFTFDIGEVPQLGIWVNTGGWAGAGDEPYYNLALEPCIGAQDSLQEAAEVYHQLRTLAPGATTEWSLGVELISA